MRKINYKEWFIHLLKHMEEEDLDEVEITIRKNDLRDLINKL